MKGFKINSLLTILVMMLISKFGFSSEIINEKQDMNTRTICNPIELVLGQRDADPKELEVSLILEKENNLKEGDFTLTTFRRFNQEEANVLGLDITFQKIIPMDSFKNINYGWSVTETQTQVYGVKVKVTANEIIGYELKGDIMTGVSTLDAYTICREEEVRYQ